MSDKPANGPAFPYETEEITYPGMMLRDYFAAKTLQGIMADPSQNASGKDIAKSAYQMADLMLVERAK